METSRLAQEIVRIIEHAAAITLKHHRADLDVKYKKDKFDPVTIADKESDDFIRREIGKVFPEDHILSEENDEIPDPSAGRIWMVDPLDGTRGFISGKESYSINIGLLENGRPVFGCVAVPLRGQVFYAEKGQGAYEKTEEGFRRLHVSGVEDIKEVRIVTRYPGGEPRQMEGKINELPFRQQISEGGVGPSCAWSHQAGPRCTSIPISGQANGTRLAPRSSWKRPAAWSRIWMARHWIILSRPLTGKDRS